MLKALIRVVFTAVAFFSIAQASYAQTFPDRAIRWIVPWPPGGGGDVIARLLGNPVADALGKPVIIENRAGAAGNIGALAVARAPADGYTIRDDQIRI